MIEVARDSGRARDNERSSRLIDEDRVDFVDKGIIVSALHLLIFTEAMELSRKIIEAKFGGCSIDDSIDTPLYARRGASLLKDTCCQALGCENCSDPFAVSPCKVIVDCDDMNRFTCECVQVKRHVAVNVFPSPVCISAIDP